MSQDIDCIRRMRLEVMRENIEEAIEMRVEKIRKARKIRKKVKKRVETSKVRRRKETKVELERY